jgi:hypothetical protein
VLKLDGVYQENFEKCQNIAENVRDAALESGAGIITITQHGGQAQTNTNININVPENRANAP